MNKSTKLKELSPTRSPKKGGKNVGFSEKALFDRKSSKVLYDSMKLSRKYANGGSNSNLPNNDARIIILFHFQIIIILSIFYKIINLLNFRKKLWEKSKFQWKI